MLTRERPFRTGLDIGSTTAKMVIIDDNREILFSRYQRHNTQLYETIEGFLENAIGLLGNRPVDIQITGSAGMGISEKTGIPFIQEVIATDVAIRQLFPEVRTLIDIGGEDSKMIFFHDHKAPDIRMNGNCAGGTGAFIDQIATVLNITPIVLNQLAKNYSTIYPIASRCGVFAKTDVQNLLSRKVPNEDIAASIFHAMAIQCMNTLARGFDVTPKLMLCGGPFAFLSEFRAIFLTAIGMSGEDLLLPENPELMPVLGASLAKRDTPFVTTLEKLSQKLRDDQTLSSSTVNNRLKPLFRGREEFTTWKQDHIFLDIRKVALDRYTGENCFLGIDSGSTTTKITVTGDNDELLFSWYKHNQGNPISTVLEGLELLAREIEKNKNPDLRISGSTVTGYGEDLIRTALNIDKGVVETIAHFTSARFISPDVSFVLDIGGQDMKAIFIDNGIINRIELNEACSSGCGSFIESFGNSLDYPVAEFANAACQADAPCNLGTRCTVFMNSKVKQSLRENASVGEISAGLAYSVIKNCLFKVLKLTSMEELGEHIVLQGGTFKNPSIVRAMEILSGKSVRCTSVPELMGAYGASLISRQAFEKGKQTSFIGLSNLNAAHDYTTKRVTCKGCENTCIVTRFTFGKSRSFFSGNKCEKFFGGRGEETKPGFNLFEYKLNALFQRSDPPLKNPLFTVGIPRILGIYDSFPFWSTLFRSCGIEVRLSSPSTMRLSEKGLGSVMSDSICFPAKLTNGHVIDLVEKGVDRIFYPITIFGTNEFKNSVNSYNCPIVSSYSEVIDSSLDIQRKHNIPFDKPVINFNEARSLKKTCATYLKAFGISKSTITTALREATAAQDSFRTNLKKKAGEVIEQASRKNRWLFVLAGRPYHLDPLINHKAPEILASLGVDVITEDSIPDENWDITDNIQVLTQWSYPNRLYRAADWASHQPDNIQFIQFNSFGCGPDALVVDEARELLRMGNKNHTLIKIDEITSTGSVRLRLRSMIESLRIKEEKAVKPRQKRQNTPTFQIEDRNRTILAPHFSDIYSPLVPVLFKLMGYTMKILPEPDEESVELGLRYSNNDICYPATIMIGDIIKALQSGKYDLDKVAVGITQTGGQCRASSYLSLIRKAMMAAGINNVPVVSVATAEGLNDQPGFEINWLKVVKVLFMATIYADSLAKMYYAVVVREKNRGESKKIHSNYLLKAVDKLESRDYKGLLELLENAIVDFNAIEVKDGVFPKIGIVGEIYVKYNSFGNQRIVDWLIDQGIEVVVPPILDFFAQDFINVEVNRKTNQKRAKLSDFLLRGLELYINNHQARINRIISKFRYYSPFHNLRYFATKADQIINLSNQFGEGWLIAAEIASFASEGINNVVSLQPFGCIANHLISKGIETKIKRIYPTMNLLFLDFEAGTSEVNILNRLYFLIKNIARQPNVA